MDFFHSLSDDQTAMIGCAAALFVSGTLMSLSYYVGRFFHKGQQMSPEPNEPQTLRMPDPMSLHAKKRQHAHSPTVANDRGIRRAA